MNDDAALFLALSGQLGGGGGGGGRGPNDDDRKSSVGMFPNFGNSEEHGKLPSASVMNGQFDDDDDDSNSRSRLSGLIQNTFNDTVMPGNNNDGPHSFPNAAQAYNNYQGGPGAMQNIFQNYQQNYQDYAKPPQAMSSSMGSGGNNNGEHAKMSHLGISEMNDDDHAKPSAALSMSGGGNNNNNNSEQQKKWIPTSPLPNRGRPSEKRQRRLPLPRRGLRQELSSEYQDP